MIVSAWARISAKSRKHPPKEDPLPAALVTGFGPFPGVPHNPSGVLAERLAAARRWRRLGWDLRAVQFPTGYGAVEERIRNEAARGPSPRLVVMLGVAARARWLRIELRAKNRASMLHRDAGGSRPKMLRLEDGPETFRHGRHGGAPLVKHLRSAQVPARLSRDCGRYVCNAAYWQMLAAIPGGAEVVFVHIPLPMRPGTRKRDPRPAMPAMERALAALLLMMLKRARLRR